MTGDTGPNVLEGGEGDDMLDGGAGSDTASYAGSAAAVQVSIAEDDITAAGGDAEGDTLESSEMDHDGDEETPEVMVSSIESLTGSDEGDTLTGDYRDNTLTGGAGNDTIVGGAGDDTLDGGDGVDNITGGAGDDTITGGAGNDTPLDGGAGNDTIDGGAGDDTIDGGEGNDTLTGGTGDDTINGGEGSDMIYAGAGDTVDAGTGPAEPDDNDATTTENPDTGVDIVSYAMQGDTDSTMDGYQGVTITVGSPAQNGVENAQEVIGSPGDDNITGSSARDFIKGGDGDDTISSGGGGGNDSDGEFDKNLADVLVGMGGNDTLSGVDGDVEVFAVHADAGNDTISGFALTEDHLHFLGFGGAADAHSCARGAGTRVICTLSTGQKVTVMTTGDFSDPLDLDEDLNIFVD